MTALKTYIRTYVDFKSRSHLIYLHSFTDPVARPLVNNLQPLMDGGFEPVMKACQGQHLSVPVEEQRDSCSGESESSNRPNGLSDPTDGRNPVTPT